MHSTLSVNDAAKLVEDLRAGRPRTDLLKTTGSGADVRAAIERSMIGFREACRAEGALGGDAPAGTPKKHDQSKDAAEGRLACVLYDELKDYGPEILTDPGFWRYLAVWEMFDFVQWRDGAACRLASFGADSQVPTWDCVPKRMFVRARIAHEASQDDRAAAALASVAGTDLWRSHILRVKTGNAPLLAKAMVAAWDAEEMRTSTVRDVAKRVKRLRSNIVFELLDQDQVTDVVARQISGARADD